MTPTSTLSRLRRVSWDPSEGACWWNKNLRLPPCRFLLSRVASNSTLLPSLAILEAQLSTRLSLTTTVAQLCLYLPLRRSPSRPTTQTWCS